MELVLQTAWGWQPAIYLFFGGLGSGLFLVAGALFLMDQRNHARLIRWSFALGLSILLLGLAFLIMDLVKPWQGLAVWRSFVNPSSWMARGVWIIGAAVLAMASCIGLTGRTRPRSWRPLVLGLVGLGMVLSLGVAAYTGVLLMAADGVPFWHSALLPCLFTASALSCGVAGVRLLSALMGPREGLRPRALRLLVRAGLALTALEGVLLAAYLGWAFTGAAAAPADPSSLAAAASAGQLTAGALSQQFWVGVVLIGLVVPVACTLSARLLYGKAADRQPSAASPFAHGPLSWLGPVCTLVGGCQLRFLMLAAALHANLVASALLTLA